MTVSEIFCCFARKTYVPSLQLSFRVSRAIRVMVQWAQNQESKSKVGTCTFETLKTDRSKRSAVVHLPNPSNPPKPPSATSGRGRALDAARSSTLRTTATQSRCRRATKAPAGLAVELPSRQDRRSRAWDGGERERERERYRMTKKTRTNNCMGRVLGRPGYT